MQNELAKQESLELNHLYLECPSCHEKYSELQAIRMRSKDNQFLCSHCCPTDDFAKTISKPEFRLVESDNRLKINRVRNMEKKMKSQLFASEDHDGIYNILSELKDASIIRNRPSDNLKRGIRGSKVTDEETLREIKENSKSRGGSAKIKKAMQNMDDETRAKQSGQFIVEISNSESQNGGPSNGSLQQEESGTGSKRAKELPEFLRGSRVMTTPSPTDSTSIDTASRGPLIPEPELSSVSTLGKRVHEGEEVDADEDDIAWEDSNIMAEEHQNLKNLNDTAVKGVKVEPTIELVLNLEEDVNESKLEWED